MEQTIHPALVGSLHSTSETIINFSPGPTSLPKAVEEQIANSFKTSGLTSLALSHRSPEFVSILERTVNKTRDVMNIPEHYDILFTHGGGHGQFSAVPLNLCAQISDVTTYVVNGTWSERAVGEASKYCTVNTISSQNSVDGKYTSFPELSESDIHPDSKYVFLCSNETVNGIELHRLPALPESRKHIPLVVDASSDFSTKPIDWEGSNIGVLFACASKNIGHPGVTLTVVRKDLLGKDKASSLCPGVLNYTINSEAKNLWNTPATFNIEVVGFLMDWLEQEGGVIECERRSMAKAEMIYDVIDNSNGFYGTPVSNKQYRSRMNVPFNIHGGDKTLTDEFLIESWERGMVGLRTLTPFGAGEYLRASIYNGIDIHQTKTLVEFMKEFVRR